MLQSINIRSSNFPFSLSPPFNPSLPPSLSSSSLTFLPKPITLHSVSSPSRTKPVQWLAQATEPTTKTINITTEPDDGPMELPPPPNNSIFATTDDPSPLQVATSVLLTGAISIFLFRSIRRRARRAKELKFRSTGVKKSLKEEALDSLKAMTPGSVEEGKSPPSAIQALLGAISAGVIALILYKFTTTIEASLNRQTISDNLSVRQITITIRTIINGICYLATFVFGINAVGLCLYAGQLAINSFMEEFASEETESKGEKQLSSQESTAESPRDSAKLNSSDGDQRSDNTQ